MSAKLKFYCGKVKQARTHAPSAQPGASVPGREVISGKLWMKKGKKAKMTKVDVVLFCGTQEPETSARLEITHKSSRSSEKFRTIPLVDVKPNVGVTSTLPCLLSCPSSDHRSHCRISLLPKPESETLYYPFQLVLQNNEVVEFYDTSEESQQKWMQKIKLLLMFPHSPVPDEPVVNSAMFRLFHAPVNPSDFKADSVWGVDILPEEVGNRIHIQGTNYLVLRSMISEEHKGRIDIVSPVDHHPRLVSWNRELIRRVGSLGNLSFIEIGRRCTGGPGLLWLYAGPEKAESLRRTLHNFLYMGDARCACGGESDSWPATCDDSGGHHDPPKPAISLGQRDHKPDGMSCSQDNLSVHADILTDAKHPSSIVSRREEGEDIGAKLCDRQRWTLQHWMQSGVNLSIPVCEERCPQDH